MEMIKWLIKMKNCVKMFKKVRERKLDAKEFEGNS